MSTDNPFVLSRLFYGVLTKLSTSQQGKLLLALTVYHFEGTEPDETFDPALAALFVLMKDAKSLEAKQSKVGRPRKAKSVEEPQVANDAEADGYNGGFGGEDTLPWDAQ